MSIEQYLSPISLDNLGFYPDEYSTALGTRMKVYTPEAGLPEIPSQSLILLGACEDRGAEKNAGCAMAPNEIRRYLYPLASPLEEMAVYDFGNIIIGQEMEDTYYALSEVMAALLERDNTVVLLGGSQDLTFAAYKAYERLQRIINISAIDSRFDLEPYEEITSRTYLKHIIMQNPNYLFFHTNIGYQTYFVGAEYVKLMEELKFDAYRLGELQHNMVRAEALVRNADLLTVDMGAIRQSDAPGNGDPSPHGFYGEEFCQMMRFAGMSDKISSLGIFEVNPEYDNHGQTAHMTAHGIWYFIEGFFNRKHDSPLLDPQSCKRFLVTLEDQGLEITFFKSKLSDRWWMQVPCDNTELREIYSRHLLLPCTYDDYQQAMNNEVPALWWRYFQRLNG